MKNIKNFNTFVNENLNKVQYNQYVYDYIYDKITEEQFNEYIFSDLTNEGLVDNLKNFLNTIKEKFLDALCNFIIEIQKLGSKILPKFLKFATTCLDYIKKFKEKHPTLFKIIIILIIMGILMAVTSQNAQAGDVSKHINLDNNSISKLAEEYFKQHLQEIHNSNPDADMNSLISQSINYIRHSSDPSFDHSQISQEAMKTSDMCLNIIKKALNHADNPAAKDILNKVSNFLTDHSLADFVKNAIK